MLEPVIIMGLVMATMELVKTAIPEENKEVSKKAMPFLILLLGAGFNILNAGVFGDGFTGPVVQAAAKQGIKFSALAAGIYGLGKAALGKS